MDNWLTVHPVALVVLVVVVALIFYGISRRNRKR